MTAQRRKSESADLVIDLEIYDLFSQTDATPSERADFGDAFTKFCDAMKPTLQEKQIFVDKLRKQHENKNLRKRI